jgi:release factor glutamine methyltransferase
LKVKQFITYFRENLSQSLPPEEITAFTAEIFSHLKSWDKTRLFLNADELLSKKETEYLYSVTERLLNNEPIQYILGYDEFFGLKIITQPGVLIPRPETEELIYALTEKYSPQSEPDILDAGTGSGCIALALAKQFPNARISACDISDEALQIAKKNSENLKLPVRFFKADLLKSGSDFPATKYDLIVSNPPYVRESEKALMQKNVLDFEPETALFVPDENPLVFYRALGEIAQKYLKTNGLLAVEINEFLARETEAALLEQGGHKTEILKDIHGKNRFVLAEF